MSDTMRITTTEEAKSVFMGRMMIHFSSIHGFTVCKIASVDIEDRRWIKVTDAKGRKKVRIPLWGLSSLTEGRKYTITHEVDHCTITEEYQLCK